MEIKITDNRRTTAISGIPDDVPLCLVFALQGVSVWVNCRDDDDDGDCDCCDGGPPGEVTIYGGRN